MPHKLTVSQERALRQLYGLAMRLARNASDPAVPELPETERIVQGGDFNNLVKALEKVKRVMKPSITTVEN